MNIKKVFKIVLYSLLGVGFLVASSFYTRFQTASIPTANADVPAPPIFDGGNGAGDDGGAGDGDGSGDGGDCSG